MGTRESSGDKGRPEKIDYLISQAFLEKVNKAEIIVGEDEESRSTFVVFGRATLTSIRSSGSKQGKARVLHVPILQGTDELEYLLTAVRLVKGYDEYEGSNSGNGA